jgi:hypothetical protein
MDPKTAKVLRRAIARYRTGIRRAFRVDGRDMRLVDRDKRVCLMFENITGTVLLDVEPLNEVTPEGIIEAMNISEVREVMES